jgi:Glycerol dehydrogenase and related enzymes
MSWRVVMIRVMRAPSRYVQGKDALLDMKRHVKMLGDSFYVVGSKTALKTTKGNIEKSFEGSDISLIFELFNGQSSMAEINRIRDLVKKNNSNVVVGIGGGKALDTAKAVAYYENLPIVIIPTVAATDAPCTALSVIYTEQGEFDQYIFYPKNPDVVIVDTAVIAKSPVRFFVAGLGDALGTFFEGRACVRTESLDLDGEHITQSGYCLAKLCYDTIIADGYKAKLAIEKGVVVPAVEKAIEANTYLSGVGASGSGLAAAHSIYNGFTVLEECEGTMHGEIVAFGTLVQLILEDSPIEEIQEVMNFCLSVGLPITLEDIGVKQIDPEKLMKVAKAACAPGESIHNMVGDVTPEELYDAFIVADNIGSQCKGQ